MQGQFYEMMLQENVGFDLTLHTVEEKKLFAEKEYEIFDSMVALLE